jgi:hypothetical protein
MPPKAPCSTPRPSQQSRPRAQAVFSPDERLVLTGTSADRGGRGGALVFFDAKTHALVRRVAVPGSAVALNWHERLNQIFVGVGARTPRLSAGFCQRQACSRARSGVVIKRAGEASYTIDTCSQSVMYRTALWCPF